MIEWFPQSIAYQYRVPYSPEGQWLRPLIPVSLRFGRTGLDLLAIVDSGADLSTFSSKVAKALGIVLERLPSSTLQGIGGSVRTWPARLTLAAAGMTFPNCPVLFVDNPECHPLLGREPVWEKLQVGFRQSAWEWYFVASP